MSISCVNYIHGSDTRTHQQIEANSAKTPPAQNIISSDSTWKPCALSCDKNSFRSRANCKIFKSILNQTSCDLFFLQNSKCTTVEWRQLTFLPRPYGVHLNTFLLRLIDSLSSKCILGTSSLLRLWGPDYMANVSPGWNFSPVNRVETSARLLKKILL